MPVASMDVTLSLTLCHRLQKRGGGNYYMAGIFLFLFASVSSESSARTDRKHPDNFAMGLRSVPEQKSYMGEAAASSKY